MGSRALRRQAWPVILVCLGILGSGVGCTLHAGLDGIDAALFGSTYHHVKQFTDVSASGRIDGEDGAGNQIKSWSTSGTRTFGTVALEWKTNQSSETGSMRGKGMSNNLQRTLGEDAIQALGDDAKCVLMPALCVTEGLNFGDLER